MIISTCPRCQEGFRVPLGRMPEDAYAMCPWCHETFPLAEVLAHLPPQLQILTADGEPITVMEPVASHAAAEVQSLTGVAIGAMDNLQGNDDLADGQQWDPNALNFGAQSGQTEGAWNAPASAQAAPMSVSPRPNRRKKGGSGIRSMIQVVVGGLLSVPIALVILLIVGRPLDLGFWPFDGQTRTLQELMPFSDDTNTNGETAFSPFEGQELDTTIFEETVQGTEDPRKSALDQIFAPDSSEDPDTFEDPDDQSSLDQTTPAILDENSAAMLTETSPESLQPKQSGIPPELPSTIANPSVSSTPLKLPESADTETINESTGTATTVITASQTKPSVPSSDSNPESKPNESVPTQVMLEVAAAIQAVKKLNESDQESDTDGLAEAYERIAEASASAQKYPNALTSLANAISQSNALSQIQEAAVTWLDYPQRSTQGIVLIGKPGSTAKSQILTLDSGRILTLTGKMSLPLAETVLILGQITPAEDVIEISFTAPIP